MQVWQLQLITIEMADDTAHMLRLATFALQGHVRILFFFLEDSVLLFSKVYRQLTMLHLWLSSNGNCYGR